MALDRTHYRLGERCKWSTDEDPWYYVDVTSKRVNGDLVEDALELPHASAVSLCAVMGSPSNHVLRVQTVIPETHDPWCYGLDQQPVAAGWVRRICAAAQTHTAWLGFIALKYVNIRIDMRGGSFRVTDSQGNECFAVLQRMLDEAEKIGGV